MIDYNRKEPKIQCDSCLYNSVFASITLCMGYINGAIRIGGISIVISLLLILGLVLGIATKKMILSFKEILLTFYLLVLFMLSMIFVSDNQYTTAYLFRFLLQGIAPLIIGAQVSDTKTIVKGNIIVGIVFIPLMLRVNFSELRSGNWMGYTYAMLPVIISAFIGLSLEKKFKVASVLILLLLAPLYFQFAMRGVWVSLVLFLVVYIIYIISNKFEKQHKKNVFLAILIFLGFCVLYVADNLDVIINNISLFLQEKFNLHIYALDKYTKYLALNKVANGRDRVFFDAIELIKQNPIFGHGIGYFESINNGGYTHNFLLQSLCECGLFTTIPLIYCLCVFYCIIRSKSKEEDLIERIFPIMLLCSSFIILLYSAVIWQLVNGWFVIGYILSFNNKMIKEDNK